VDDAPERARIGGNILSSVSACEGRIMLCRTGNMILPLNAKTGAIIWVLVGIDQTISTVCCGWANRVLRWRRTNLPRPARRERRRARHEDRQVVWKTPIEKWQNGYGVTSGAALL